MWELTDGHSVSEKTYWNKWKSHMLDWLAMDEKYLNKLYGLME